ncbi:chitin synthase 3 complex protein Csi2p [Monosporozyma unispora]|nr:hypothetical protein C6P44_003522 [Kazachstania unispora]
MLLDRRDLPQLVTARTTSTTSKPTTKSSVHKTTPTSTSDKDDDHSSSYSHSSNTHATITTQSSITLSSSSSHASTSIVHATVMIPNQENTLYRYNHPGDIDGTVYIAFGSVLGFLLFIILLIWSILSFKSWYVARKQTQYRNTLKQRYNNPVDDFFTENGFLDETDSWCSQSSNDSDISEKVIKQQNSVGKALNAEDFQELFVSPTEVLFHGGNSNVSNTTLSIPSGASSPMHTFGNVYNNTSMDTPVITINNASILNSEPFLTSSNNSSNNTNDTPTTKKFRPPSVHLDQLLNDLE